MSRDARINPVAGDVLAIGVKQWEVVGNSGGRNGIVKVVRDCSCSYLDISSFRSFFKLASTVRYGDET